MHKAVLSVALFGLLLLGCHTITEELPTQPSQSSPGPTLSIPLPVFGIPGVSPTPGPTPTPGPGPAPTPTPPPTPAPTPTPEPPPSSGGCGNPIPGPISKINVKVHIRGANRITFDSTPLVGPDDVYCRKIGFTDGRRFCPARPEGHPERFACEALIIGRAKDTGRVGPTWSVDGKACVLANGCENHPDNQFLAFGYKSGLYEACAQNGVCGGVMY